MGREIDTSFSTLNIQLIFRRIYIFPFNHNALLHNIFCRNGYELGDGDANVMHETREMENLSQGPTYNMQSSQEHEEEDYIFLWW